jgi:activator of HSP90 ATPase
MFKETIDKKSYLFYKNIYDDSYGINLDFNTLFKLYSESEEELESLIRSKFPPAANNVLSKVYQIRNINNSRFNKLLNELKQQTKKTI